MPTPADKTRSQVLRRDFPGQPFQFPPHPGDVLAADSPHAASSFREVEFLLQPGESAPKRDDLRFRFVHFNAKRRRFLPDHIQAGEQMFFVVVDDVAIIHISSVELTMHLLFDPVVESIRDGQRQILTNLATQPQADRSKHSDQMQDQVFQPFVRNVALQNFCNSIMADAVEKFMEIIDQDVPIPPKFAIKLVQMSFQASERVINAFSFLTGRVIRNQPRTKNGSEQVVAQTTLHHTLRNMYRADVPVFPALKNVKLDKSVTFPCATQQFALSYAHIDKCVLFVGLGRMFPPYAAPTFFIGGIQVSKSEYVSKLNFQGEPRW